MRAEAELQKQVIITWTVDQPSLFSLLGGSTASDFRVQTSTVARAMPSSPHRRRLLLLPLLVAAAALRGPLPAGAATCKAWLVQSIPTDMPHLRRVPGVLSTGIPHSLSLSPAWRLRARVGYFNTSCSAGVDGSWMWAAAVDWGLGARTAYDGMCRKKNRF